MTRSRYGATWPRQRPERVFHLAALASVGRSWQAPAETIAANQAMTANLLEALRAEAPDAAVLIASSGEVYGAPETLPVTEDAPLRPASPYAVSKVGSELVAEMYERVHGMRVVVTRAFNHAGPGQPADYVVGSLTRQVAEAELAAAASAVVRTGDPDVSRDFSDVRDVAAPTRWRAMPPRAPTTSRLAARPASRSWFPRLRRSRTCGSTTRWTPSSSGPPTRLVWRAPPHGSSRPPAGGRPSRSRRRCATPWRIGITCSERLKVAYGLPMHDERGW